MMTYKEASDELQRRCNGLKNPNHVLEVALQMQKEIFKSLEAQLANTEQLTCDGCTFKTKDGCIVVAACPRHESFKKLPIHIQEISFDRYEPKDTQ